MRCSLPPSAAASVDGPRGPNSARKTSHDSHLGLDLGQLGRGVVHDRLQFLLQLSLQVAILTVAGLVVAAEQLHLENGNNRITIHVNVKR